MKKHIIFDIDGTLLDTTEPLIISMQAALAAAGKHFHKDDLKVYMGITGIDTLEIIGVENPEQTIALWEKLLKDEAWRIKVFEGTPELVQKLHSLGYTLGMVTSKTREELEEDWPRLPHGECFTTVVCATDTEEHKPHPAPLLKYLERAGITADEAIYVGDSAYDMKCAAGAGVDFYLAVWGANDPTLPAKAHLKHPMELLNYL